MRATLLIAALTLFMTSADAQIALSEDFESGIPVTWSVIDNAGNGVDWVTTGATGYPTDCEEANYTNGTGLAACVSSDAFGVADFDVELRTPSMDLSSYITVELTYTVNYQNFDNEDFFDVDVSTDGGSGWTNLLSWNEDHGGFFTPPGEDVAIDLISYAGESDVIIRFYYYDPEPDDFEWYVEVDDVLVSGVIPVELVSFTGTANGTDVALNWETASETNNAGFEVQMLEGENWNALGFVDGHGTTTEAQTYSFDAGDMSIGTQTFRLKQIDFDGAFEYSGEVEVTIETPGSHVLSAAYPNPFNPQSQFTLAVAQEQHVTAELFNTLGQRVAILFDGSVEANQSQLVTIDGAGLASGMYVVRVNGERFSDALSVTLLK